MRAAAAAVTNGRPDGDPYFIINRDIVRRNRVAK